MRSVVVTGASRGLGLATAALLYQHGWRVVAAMRSVDTGLDAIRAATGAGRDDSRLVGVQLDLTDSDSIKSAAESVLIAVGAPTAIVHNAGVSAIGFVEEIPESAWQQIFATNVFGPVEFTKAVLPAMREAGEGRIVLVASQGGLFGMQTAAPYAAAKSAAERWAEAMAAEVAPFGIGVTVLMAGVFDTDIINDRAPGYPDYRDFEGVFASQHEPFDKRGHMGLKMAKSPAVFARAVAKALERDRAPFVRRGVGIDARMMMLSNRVLPAAMMYQLARISLGQPRFGSLNKR